VTEGTCWCLHPLSRHRERTLNQPPAENRPICLDCLIAPGQPLQARHRFRGFGELPPILSAGDMYRMWKAPRNRRRKTRKGHLVPTASPC